MSKGLLTKIGMSAKCHGCLGIILLKYSLKKEDLDIHCLMLLGAYQILHSNVAVHASIFETVNVTNELNKSWAKKLVNAILREINRQVKTNSAKNQRFC
jgi:transcription termination factor NusB